MANEKQSSALVRPGLFFASLIVLVTGIVCLVQFRKHEFATKMAIENYGVRNPGDRYWPGVDNDTQQASERWGIGNSEIARTYRTAYIWALPAGIVLLLISIRYRAASVAVLALWFRTMRQSRQAAASTTRTVAGSAKALIDEAKQRSSD